MSLKEAVTSVFSKYAAFSGRARRSEYWYFVLFEIIVGLILGVVGLLIGESAVKVIDGLWSLAILVPTLALTWRRLHDIGKSGGWFFISLVPLVGEILLLVWMCRDSQPGSNQYGPNPKGV